MKDFSKKFATSMAAAAFGISGFISMYYGSLITTSLTRALIAGALFFVLGRIFAIILYDGPVITPAEEMKALAPHEAQTAQKPGKQAARR
ncbi:MAG: hypothetical protein HZB29_01720 [Nitrospinae bacterium]|nr:hypothetical protein [Nitrospinota bacterium]